MRPERCSAVGSTDGAVSGYSGQAERDGQVAETAPKGQLPVADYDEAVGEIPAGWTPTDDSSTGQGLRRRTKNRETPPEIERGQRVPEAGALGRAGSPLQLRPSSARWEQR